MEKMQVRFERCKGCGLCVTVCPKQIVALQSTNVDTVSGATGMKKDILPRNALIRTHVSVVPCVQ